MAYDSYNHGVWLGYGLGAGVGNYDGTSWRFCLKLQHVNDMLVKDGIVYAGTDKQAETEGEAHGLWVLNNGLWQDYTQSLPDSRVFGIFEDGDSILVGTWEGMAKVDLANHGLWEVVYSTQQNGVSNHIHAFLKDKDGDIWIGSVATGVYWYTGGRWLNLVSNDTPGLKNTPDANPKGVLPGNNVRDIVQGPDGAVWIATEAIHGGTEQGQKGGITRYTGLGGWNTFTSEYNGGADRVMDINIDPAGRVWIASKDKGTMYLVGNRWIQFDSTPSNVVVFGNGQVFIGTDGFGLIIQPMP
jgi:ligand-binding sensor domain-containing protein